MRSPRHSRSRVVDAIFDLLDPVPFGCFVAALVFDVVYARTGEVLWTRAASWLITLGLVAAVLPRLIDVVRLRARDAFPGSADRVDVGLNLLAFACALANASVHTRDAYGVVPVGQWLSIATVALIAIGRVITAGRRRVARGPVHG